MLVFLKSPRKMLQRNTDRATCAKLIFGLPGCAAFGVLPFGGASCNITKSSFSFPTAALATKKAHWVIVWAPASSNPRTIPSLRPPAWELLGNQNQLLVLSPLRPFWLGVNCGVVFSKSSL
ncbi:hypothetical protein PBY51_015261 [Eleginops maclovinus]|uniref:Uncharacterized protein n=1 Tax=Eleginops maclovinus TaxID=56733 RepID=A0AAN8AGC1_ELEMC|nr:hypothetical protein PBY51_015261 [Eleginops maclovinus]